MGRSPKVESNEPRPQPPAQQQPPPPTTTQPYAPPAPQAQEPPPRAATPAATATPSAPRAVTESEALARDLRDGVVSGFVGGGTVVSGDADFKGMLRIDGRFTGRVRSEKGSLIVSAGGVVEARVEVATARINGTVNGDIVATERIEFGRSARVRGDIQTPALVIEEGAIFEGGCRMLPRSKPEPARAPEAEAPKAEANRDGEPRAPSGATRPRQPAAAGPAPSQPAQASRAAVVTSNAPEPSA
jgi:cytoskeletal protein CcmA (bactofilin family)